MFLFTVTAASLEKFAEGALLAVSVYLTSREVSDRLCGDKR